MNHFKLQPNALALAYKTRRSIFYALSLSALIGLSIPNVSFAHPTELQDDPHEHLTPTLPASNANVRLIGKAKVNQTFDARVSDVAVMGDYAYLGVFDGGNNCQKGGVIVFNISNPAAPKQTTHIRLGNNYSYTGEGVQVIKMNTPSFKGDLLIATSETCAEASLKSNPQGAIGGVSLVDVTNPKNPKILVEGFGDIDPPGDAFTPANAAHGSHSAFAWVHGSKVYVAMMDIPDTGIDIVDITDPRHPVMINEDFKPAQLFPSILQPDSFTLKEVFGHDVTVKEMNGKSIMLLSNWDSGYIVLDVSNPTPGNIRLIADTDYALIDPLATQYLYGGNASIAPPTGGNAHYAEFSPDNQFILGTDEIFGDVFIEGNVVASNYGNIGYEFFAGGTYPEAAGNNPITGQVKFGGRGCNTDARIPPGDGTQIAVIERGVCFFTDKVANAEAAGGYIGVMIMNREGEDACNAPLSPSGMGISRDVGYKLFGLTYNDAECKDGNLLQAPIALGTTGDTVNLTPFDAVPGYVHLYKFNPAWNSLSVPQKMYDKALYTIAENLNASAPIHMPVHEVTWSVKSPGLAYLSHYNGGLRVIKVNSTTSGPTTTYNLQEVGQFVENSNDFWGVQLWTKNGKEYILASDLNFGLYIFEYIGPGAPNP